MFEVKLKIYLNKRIVKKLKKTILSKSFEHYRTNAENYIEMMWLSPALSKIHGSDYKLVDLAINELVAENKIIVTKSEDNSYIENLALTNSTIIDLSPDTLPRKAFFKKYLAHILSVIAIVISIIALFKPQFTINTIIVKLSF